ncbi:MAG: hypothetical protein IJS47_01995 [Clostridia bacterium]|nr:hypothetical protein [Clostridia bacterium]
MNTLSIQKLSREEWEEKVEFFKDKVIDEPDIKDETGTTFLYWAVLQGSFKYVVALLYRGANPNIHTKDGDCPVALAIRLGNWDMVNLLETFGGMC